MSTDKPVLLVVEDDPNDLYFLERALAKAQVPLTVQVATNGEQAVQYLSGHGQFSDRQIHPLPKFVLLDLKMPLFNGFQVLEWLRSQPALSSIPVFVLTGSAVDRDRERALELGAKAYLVKPPTPNMLTELLSPLHQPAHPAVPSTETSC